MARTGILHMGLPKTATSSCQEAFFTHRKLLLDRHGYFYPSVAPRHNSMLVAMFAEDPTNQIALRSKQLTSRQEAEDLRQRYFAQLERDIDGTPWETLVLISEGVSNMSPKSLAALRDWLFRFTENWTVLFWSRHPVSYSTSGTQQQIKSGEVLERLLAKPPMPNFRRRASNAFDAFGRDNVRLVAFEDALAEPGSVVAAFCRRLGLPEETALEIGAASVHKNESLSALATQILSSLNRQRPRFLDGRLNPERGNEVEVLRRIKGRKFQLPDAVVNDIRRQSRDDVAWLNETFGTQLYLDVFDPEAERPATDAPDFAPESVDSLALLLSDLLNQRAPSRFAKGLKGGEAVARTVNKGAGQLRSAMADLFARRSRSR